MIEGLYLAFARSVDIQAIVEIAAEIGTGSPDVVPGIDDDVKEAVELLRRAQARRGVPDGKHDRYAARDAAKAAIGCLKADEASLNATRTKPRSVSSTPPCAFDLNKRIDGRDYDEIRAINRGGRAQAHPRSRPVPRRRRGRS